MTTHLKLSKHGKTGEPIFEVWDDGEFIAAIYPHGERGVCVVSKYLMEVGTYNSVARAMSTIVTFGGLPQ